MVFIEIDEENEVVIDVWEGEIMVLVVVWFWVEGVIVIEMGEVNEVVINFWGDDFVIIVVMEEVLVIIFLLDIYSEIWVWVMVKFWVSEEVGWVVEDIVVEVCFDLVKMFDGNKLFMVVVFCVLIKMKWIIKG